MNSKRFSSLKNDDYIKQEYTNRELNIKPIKYSKTNLFLVMAITYIFSVNMFTFDVTYDWNLPNFLSRGSLMLMACIVYLGVFKLLFAKLDSISGLLVLFGFFSVVSTLVNYETQKINIIYVISVQLLWVAVFFVAYNKTRKQLKETTVRIILYTFPMVFFMYIFIYLKTMEVLNIGNVNLVYYVFCFLPFVLCVKKKNIKIIFLLMISFSILISMKRTAFLAFVVALFVSYIIDMHIMGKERKKKLINTLVIFLIIITGVFMYNYIVDAFNLDIILRLQKLLTDGGSGRDIIYRSVWHYQLNSTAGEWLIGRGYNGVSNTSAAGLGNLFFSSSAAHNDFLEILYDYGIIGLSIYLLFCIKLIKHSIKLIRLKSDMAGPFAASLVIFFMLSMFSILILYPRYYLYLALFWAMCFTEDYKVRKNY